MSRFLRVKTYRYSLNRSYIINGTLSVKISQRYGAVFLIHFNGGYRRRYFLYHGNAMLSVIFVCKVNTVLQNASSQSPCMPCAQKYNKNTALSQNFFQPFTALFSSLTVTNFTPIFSIFSLAHFIASAVVFPPAGPTCPIAMA